MYTQCPHCQSIFQISAEQLKAAGGDVRCGQCLTVFNALSRLSEELPKPDIAGNSHEAGDHNQWAAKALASTLADDSRHNAAATEPLFDDEASPAVEVEAAVSSADTDDSEHGGADIYATATTESAWSTVESSAPERAQSDLATAHAGNDVTIDTESDAAADEATATPMEGPALDTVSLDSNQSVQSETNEMGDADLDALATWEESQVEAAAETAEGSDWDRSEQDREDDTASTDSQELGDIGLVSADLEGDIGRAGEDEFAEFAELAEPMDSSEAIIIEEADLAPLSSQDYRDDMSDSSASRADLSEVNAAGETRAASTGPEINAAEAVSEQAAEEQAAATEEAAVSATEETPQGTAKVDRPSRPVPAVILDELHAAKAERLRPSNTPWTIGTLLLMLTLVLQAGYYYRDNLAQEPTLRPWLIKLCQMTGCTLSQPYDISLIDIIGRDVRSHPTARKALIASTTLINNASFAQPYPLLTLVFSDITGTELARRRFTPREYLSSDIDIDAGMMPDTPVRIELELVDPGKAAVNYEFHAELDPRIRRPLS